MFCVLTARFVRVYHAQYFSTFQTIFFYWRLYIYKFVKILLCTTTYTRLICVRAPRRRYFNSSRSAKIPPIKYVMCAIYRYNANYYIWYYYIFMTRGTRVAQLYCIIITLTILHEQKSSQGHLTRIKEIDSKRIQIWTTSALVL